MELQQAIVERRSIRRFTDYHVTDEEIVQILEAARMAPSWANVQPWEFIVVRDTSLIEKIVGTYSATNPARKCSLAASALIVACAKTNISGCKDGRDVTALANWYMFDLGMAVQNICLKAYELGLGTVVVGYFDHQQCNKLLQMPQDTTVVVTIPVGKPEVSGKQGPPRKELMDCVYVNTYGNKFFK